MGIPYTTIDHTADFGIQVFGEGPEALFGNAALALFDLIVPSKKKGASRRDAGEEAVVALRVTGADWADLMVNWLREALYLWTGEEKVLRSIRRLEISDLALRAEIAYTPYDPERHAVRHEIKAVTYHQAQVRETSSCWEARIILDM